MTCSPHSKSCGRAAVRDRPLWRISTAPSKGHEIAVLITPAAQMYYDWGGGLIWAAMPFANEPDAASIRGAVASLETAAKLEPGQAHIHYQLGRAYIAAGRQAEGEGQLEIARQLKDKALRRTNP